MIHVSIVIFFTHAPGLSYLTQKYKRIQEKKIKRSPPFAAAYSLIFLLLKEVETQHVNFTDEKKKRKEKND